MFSGVGALAAAYSIRNQAREQRQLTKELSRRADFAIIVALAPVIAVEHADLDSATVRTTASSMNLRFQIGITNTAIEKDVCDFENKSRQERAGELVAAARTLLAVVFALL